MGSIKPELFFLKLRI